MSKTPKRNRGSPNQSSFEKTTSEEKNQLKIPFIETHEKEKNCNSQPYDILRGRQHFLNES